jgi:hypothetical protein
MDPRRVDAAVFVIAVVAFVSPHTREHPKVGLDVTEAIIRHEHCRSRPHRIRGTVVYLPEH